MLEINGVRMKGRELAEVSPCVPSVSHPISVPNNTPAGLSPKKARLVQRTTTRYEKGLKRLSEI